jgi:DnaJ-class molecular chaperone
MARVNQSTASFVLPGFPDYPIPTFHMDRRAYNSMADRPKVNLDCTNCQGVGVEFEPCRRCHGEGRFSEECDECKGKGSKIVDHITFTADVHCNDCEGRGKVTKICPLKIAVPCSVCFPHPAPEEPSSEMQIDQQEPKEQGEFRARGDADQQEREAREVQARADMQ